MTIFDLYVEQGSTFTQQLNLGRDLTNYTVDSSMSDSNGVYTTSIADMVDAANGLISISMTHTETTGMRTGIGKYDIELEYQDGTKEEALKGRVYVDGEVTV